MLDTQNCPAGYEIDEEIGRTDRAVVYQARDLSHGHPVALKLVQNDASGVREVEMLERVQRANPGGPAHVMRMQGLHEMDYDLWIVLELFHGTLHGLSRDISPPLLTKADSFCIRAL